MSEDLEFIELREHRRRGDDLIAVHYGCENLYAVTDRPPGISSVAFCQLGRSDAVTFSVVDAPEVADPAEAELDVLRSYFGYLQTQASATFVHWNMNKPDFGFSAVTARYRFLSKEDIPYAIPRDRTYDLDDLISARYGSEFAPHPRLSSLVTLNGLTRHHALSGKDEAEKFKAGDHGSIRRSVGEKARWIAILGDLFLQGALKTATSAGSLEFAEGQLDAVQTVIQLGRRFLYVQRELRSRFGSRKAMEFDDEHDDQDLFRALLRVFFDDVRPEDYVPSYAGGSSRIDFVLPQFEVAVELKHAGDSLDSKQLGEQLIVDVERYGARGDIRHLICLVFDHQGLLVNPRGLESDISRDATTDIAVTVVILDR